jgi:hypothetical protein
VRPPSDTPLSGSNSLAIAIAGSSITDDVRQRHVGILYRTEANVILLLHLGWHERLFHEDWPGQHYSWIEVGGIDPEVQELFVDWVSIVVDASRDNTAPIPYSAFFRPTGNFDSSGHFVNRHDGTGLTCATFILALFADYQLPLILPNTWPRRIEDSRWFRRIWSRLRPYVPPVDLIKQFQRRRLLKRYRPEEVAAAGALFSGAALSFDPVSAKTTELESTFPR